MRHFLWILAALALALAGTGRARAEIIITFSPNGANVDAKAMGSLNLTGLTFVTSLNINAGVEGDPVDFNLGNPGFVNPTDIYGGIMGPSSIGPGGFTQVSTGPGPSVGVDEFAGAAEIFVPAGYHSGDQLTSSATWDNTTISGLGLTPGTYTWTWGSGPTADDIKVVISATPVPEPSSLILAAMGIGVVGCCIAIRRRRTAAALA